jgi:cGMP-dependent protein kinase
MAIHRHSVLTDLTEDARDIVISRMKHFRLGPAELIFEQGAVGVHFFVVGSGALEVLVNGEKVNVLKSGDSFGELALLHNIPRSATVRTLEPSDLWGLDRRTFKDAVEQVNLRSYRENYAFLDKVSLFSQLTPRDKDRLLTALTAQRFLPGKPIVKEGEQGDVFYIIKEGTVSCSVNGTEVRKMHRGESFGEQALLYNTLRTASVTAEDTVRVLSVGREQLVEVLGSSLQHLLCKNSLRIAFDQSEQLNKLTQEQKECLVEAMQTKTYTPGQQVIAAGEDLSEVLRVVLRGGLKAGELNLAVHCILGDRQGRAQVPVVAVSETDVAEVSRYSLERILGGELRSVFEKNEGLAVLKRVSIFRGLPAEKLSLLLSVLQPQHFTDQAFIFRQGEPGDALYILDSGQVKVIKDDTVLRVLGRHSFFGERSVLTHEARTASVIAQGTVKCLVLHRSEFLRVVDESVSRLLAHRLELQDDTVSLSQLVVVKELGKGMFGEVNAVVHKTKGTIYALKSVSRRKIRAYDMFSSLQLERQILLEIDHHFIMKLVKTFKDDVRVYFLTELVMGMDLFDVLRKLGLVKEADTKFYAASLLLMLENLHERNIIYRDLKPENIVVDEQGYLKLVDFGTVKVLKGRTFTTIGTPHYMAPEVILGKGYGLSADLWSLGVMLYEFLCGGVPFGEDEDDPYTIYEKILRDNLRWSSNIARASKVRDFIEILLSKNESVRNCGVAQLRKHKWLAGFEWVTAT